MKRLIRNDNYALSTSDFPLWSSSKDQRLNENRDVQDSFITSLATGGSKTPPLFCPPRAAECFGVFFLYGELVLVFPSLRASLPAFVLGIFYVHAKGVGGGWGLSVTVLTARAVAFSPTSEPGPTSASTPTNQRRQPPLLPSSGSKRSPCPIFTVTIQNRRTSW